MLHANSNHRRVYALRSYTVVCRKDKWFFKRTDSGDRFKGPYRSTTSVSMMIAKELNREIKRRDGLPT